LRSSVSNAPTKRLICAGNSADNTGLSTAYLPNKNPSKLSADFSSAKPNKVVIVLTLAPANGPENVGTKESGFKDGVIIFS